MAEGGCEATVSYIDGSAFEGEGEARNASDHEQ
jgi:hypothetical protein